MEKPVGQPAVAVDITRAPSASTTKSPPVLVSRCQCRKPHSGHEPKNAIPQFGALCLNEAASSDSIHSIPHPSTPSTTASTPPSTQPALDSDTPRKISSSNGMVDTRQNERKEQVGKEIEDLTEELCSYCFSSSFFPTFQDGEYQKLMESLPLLTLKKFKLTYPSAVHTASREPWPIGSNEKVYYPPFASLLNEIVDHFKKIINRDDSKRIHFIVYDKPMAPGTPTSLKPDLLLVDEEFVKLNILQWKHPIIPIEVKNDFWDALKQIGTYAREMFVARPGRQICWALYFHHPKSTFQVILFTPDSVHYTQPVTITSAVGYREMVKVIVALLSQPDLLTIGEDPSRDSFTKLLPNGDRLKIQGVEFDRKALVGRKTRIMSVTVVGSDGKGVESTVSEDGGSPASIRKSARTRNPPLSLKREVFTKQAPKESPSATTLLSSSSRQPGTRSAATSPEKQASATSRSATSPPSSFQRFSTNSAVTSPSGQALAGSPSASTSPHERPRTRSATSLLKQTEEDSQPTLPDTIGNLEADYTKKIRRNPDEKITFAKKDDTHLEIGEEETHLKIGVEETHLEIGEEETHLEIGEHLVIKESWPLSSRQEIEWNALLSCKREFGVPEVVYKVTGKHPMKVDCTQEQRIPQHIALREKGTRLQDAESPRMLLTAVLHAIIGHWNFFRNDWLHRDVSIGNVLILSVAVTKSSPAGLEGSEHLTECHGMLIDGDAMVCLAPDRKLGDHRSCTLPFLSRRLVKAWGLGIKTFDQYHDDLESFAWVLLWALIEIAENHNKATKFDRRLVESLSRNDLLSLEMAKIAIASLLKRLAAGIAKGSQKSQSTSLLDPFIVILDHWFDLTESKELYGDDRTLPSNEDSTQFYKDFIAFATKRMKDLPEKWHF